MAARVSISIQGTTGNTIGGTTADAGNVISGNAGDGVDISGAGTSGNILVGDFIGTNAGGTAAIANADGVDIEGTAGSNTIGGSTLGARDVISGNTLYGVEIGVNGTQNNSAGSVVEGDYIGTDVTGNVALGNADGISTEGTSDNTIGGTASGAGNVIAGNDGTSFAEDGSQVALASSSNLVEGNLIGLAADGLALGRRDRAGCAHP